MYYIAHVLKVSDCILYVFFSNEIEENKKYKADKIIFGFKTKFLSKLICSLSIIYINFYQNQIAPNHYHFMSINQRAAIEKIKKELHLKIANEWPIKWKPILKCDFPADFNSINLNAFAIELADEINKAVVANTKIDNKNSLVGKQTLYRYFENIEKDTNFQISTKNGIACYLGYNGWDDFLEKKNDSIDFNPNNTNTDLELEQKKNNQNNYFTIKNIAIVLIPLMGLISIFLYKNSTTVAARIYPKTIPFKIISTTNNGIAPSKFHIAYDITGIKYDSAFINYDGFKVPLVNSKDTISYTYVQPAFKTITLRIDTVCYYISASIGSKSWVAFFKNGPNLPEKMFRKNGKMHIDLVDIPKELFDQKDYYVFYQKIADFGISADSLTLETSVKNPESEGGISCYDVSISTLSDLEFISQNVGFNILHPSCTDYVHLQVGDINIGYKANKPKVPLTPFGIDISNWTKIKYIIKNKILTVFVNDTKIYEVAYQKKLGPIKMLQIGFKGSGSIDYVKMSNSITGQLKFNETFD